MVLYKILETIPNEAKEGPTAILPLTPLDAKDGFIHLSTADQVQGTLNTFFSSHTEIVLLHVNAPDSKDIDIPEGQTGNKTNCKIKWDWVESRKQYFPHIYGDLTNADIARVEILKKTGQQWQF